MNSATANQQDRRNLLFIQLFALSHNMYEQVTICKFYFNIWPSNSPKK